LEDLLMPRNYKYCAPIGAQLGFTTLTMHPIPKPSQSLQSIGHTLLILLVVSTSACVIRERSQAYSANEGQSADLSSSARININTASVNELETLPGIGKGLAERIVEHRKKYGPFRRPEHLIIVRGISDKRFRAIRDLITVE
jgi:competence ComEA-like helix-hairpin-helix protein